MKIERAKVQRDLKYIWIKLEQTSLSVNSLEKYDDNLRASKTIETVVTLANLTSHVSNRVKTTRQK